MSTLRRLEKQRRKWAVRSVILMERMQQAFREKWSYEKAIAARKARPGWAGDGLRPSRIDD
jgi:hypothetical protein